MSDLGDKTDEGVRPALGSLCGLSGGHGQILCLEKWLLHRVAGCGEDRCGLWPWNGWEHQCPEVKRSCLPWLFPEVCWEPGGLHWGSGGLETPVVLSLVCTMCSDGSGDGDLEDILCVRAQ